MYINWPWLEVNKEIENEDVYDLRCDQLRSPFFRYTDSRDRAGGSNNFEGLDDANQAGDEFTKDVISLNGSDFEDLTAWSLSFRRRRINPSLAVPNISHD